jgi:hypothetical protein
MTYNFDADCWFENRKALLESRREGGELDAESYAAALDALERRYEEIVQRLDGTFRIPGAT